jgi:Zn-dependent peptidase ImmA (M78 family)/transcriptional regulator with XRE-family HTH domain
MNPRMLTLLRESRGLTQTKLAASAGISQAMLSKIENGLTVADESTAVNLAKQLHYPVEVLGWDDDIYGFGSATFHHRKQQSLGQTALRRNQAHINLVRMRIVRLLRGLEFVPKFSIPDIEIDEFGSASEVAAAVRAAWLMPMGPVANVAKALEDAGGIVTRLDFASTRISAISTNTPDAPPLFVLNAGQPGDRERFTLAHELGHIVMHGVPAPSGEAEREADEFASEFLMPAAEIRPQLVGLDLRRAAQLKQSWRTSISSIVRRARDLGAIDDRRYKSLNVQISQRGWRKLEPVDVGRDEPRVIRLVTDVHRREHSYDSAELAALVGLEQGEFVEAYGEARGGLRAV